MSRSANEVDGAGSTVDPIDMNPYASPQKSGFHDGYFHRQPGQVGIDQQLDIAHRSRPVSAESPSIGAGVDRHLELLSSTIGFEQVDDRGASSAGNVGRCGFGHVDVHVKPNHMGLVGIPKVANGEHMFDTRAMVSGQVRNLAVDSFESDERADALARRAEIQLVGGRVTPMALAREQTLPVLEPLHPLFPEKALRRGTVIEVNGLGATSLALAVAAGPSTSGSWTAVVGDPELGLAAAEELGVVLERLLIVRPERSQWSASLAALIGAIDVVIAAPRHQVRDADARRMAARLRERGSVLIHLGNRWPTGADVRLEVVESEWRGLGIGHGLLTSRRITVRGGGRGSASRPRSLELMVPGPDGLLASVGHE